MTKESLRIYRAHVIELITNYWADTRYLTDEECDAMLGAIIQHAQALRLTIGQRHDFDDDDGIGEWIANLEVNEDDTP